MPIFQQRSLLFQIVELLPEYPSYDLFFSLIYLAHLYLTIVPSLFSNILFLTFINYSFIE